MISNRITPEELWSRQQICSLDVDYALWNKKRESIQELAQISQSCLFTVDVFKGRYDFASENFAHLFGYDPDWIRTIQKQGDVLEDRIHPDDRIQLFDYQIEHGQFIYGLPAEERNDYQQIFQFRMLNATQNYVNVISRQQVLQTDKAHKAWIILGRMDFSPDQSECERVSRTVLNRKSGEIVSSSTLLETENQLTEREKEILKLVRQGLLSKEIAAQLGLSIYTVSNHRKNILFKLHANNSIEAIKHAKHSGLFDSI